MNWMKRKEPLLPIMQKVHLIPAIFLSRDSRNFFSKDLGTNSLYIYVFCLYRKIFPKR